MLRDRSTAPAQSARSVALAGAITVVLIAVIGLTAADVRRARLVAPPAASSRENIDYLVTPRSVPTPIAPAPILPSPIAPRAATPTVVAPNERTPPVPSPGVRQGAPAPVPSLPARADSGVVAAEQPGALLRRPIGTTLPADAKTQLCVEIRERLTLVDSARSAVLGCPPPLLSASARRDSGLAIFRRGFQTMARNPIVLSQQEKDALARERAMAVANTPVGVPVLRPLGALGGGSIAVPLPFGGPSNAQRKRDRILNAEVTATLARIKAAGAKRARERADSAARADSTQTTRVP